MNMEGGGKLKGLYKFNRFDLIGNILDQIRINDTLYGDKPFSPQLLVYLDNKSIPESSNKNLLTIEEAREILRNLDLPTEDDATIDLTFLREAEAAAAGQVAAQASAQLEAQAAGQAAAQLEAQAAAQAQTAAQAQAEAAAQAQAQARAEEAAQAQAVRQAEAAAREVAADRVAAAAALETANTRAQLESVRCRNEINRLNGLLSDTEFERKGGVENIAQFGRTIVENLRTIAVKNSEISASRAQLETLNEQLAEQALVGQANQRLMTEISQLRPRIEQLERERLQVTTENERLSNVIAAKQLNIVENSRRVVELTQELEESARNLGVQQASNAGLQQQIGEGIRADQEFKLQLQENKRNQLEFFSGEIQRLLGLLPEDRGDETNLELLQKFDAMHLLLHYYKLSKNILGETPETRSQDGLAIDEGIFRVDADITALGRKLTNKGRECDELLARIQGLEGTIQGLLGQVSIGVRAIPEGLGRLTSLNRQAEEILGQLQELQRRPVQNSQELQQQISGLTRDLNAVTANIGSLQGEIRERFGGIDAAIRSGNEAVTTATGVQSAANVQAILAGQTVQTAEIGNRIARHQEELGQQTAQLADLRTAFVNLEQQGQENLASSNRTQQLLQTCLTEKQQAQEQLLASQGTAGQLRLELTALEARRAQAEQAQRAATAEAERMSGVVRLTAQTGAQTSEALARALAAQEAAEQRLREEQQRGNPQEIRRLEAALQRELNRVTQANAAAAAAQTAEQQATERQQTAEQAAQQTAIQKAQVDGALEAAERARLAAEQSFQNATVEAAAAAAAENARQAEQLQQLQQQAEVQTRQRVEEARQAALAEKQAEIVQLQGRVQAAEAAQAAIQAASEAAAAGREAAARNTAVAEAAAAAAARETEVTARATAAALELARVTANLAARDATIAALQLQVNTIPALQAQITTLQDDIRRLTVERNNAQAIVDWHRNPQVNITTPVPPGGFMAGTRIEFNVVNRGPGGRTVAFFNYGLRTDYLDITNVGPHYYTVQIDLVEYGAFNF
jgi:hypothetical protein